MHINVERDMYVGVVVYYSCIQTTVHSSISVLPFYVIVALPQWWLELRAETFCSECDEQMNIVIQPKDQ